MHKEKAISSCQDQLAEAIKEYGLESDDTCMHYQQSRWERMFVDVINATRIGPLALGGKNTAIGTFIEIGPQRASGARIVCLRLGCCYDPRRATVTLC